MKDELKKKTTRRKGGFFFFCLFKKNKKHSEEKEKTRTIQVRKLNIYKKITAESPNSPSGPE